MTRHPGRIERCVPSISPSRVSRASRTSRRSTSTRSSSLPSRDRREPASRLCWTRSSLRSMEKSPGSTLTIERGAGFRSRREPLPHRTDSPAQWRSNGSIGGAGRRRLLQESGGPGSHRERSGSSDSGAWRACVHASRDIAPGRVRQVSQSATERPAQHAADTSSTRRLRADA